MPDTIKADICIIGAGSGGLTVAAGAAQMGARTVLIEAGKMGGDCLNYGCVPSKALIAAARRAHAMRAAAPFGIAPVEPRIDFAAVKDHVERAIAAIAPHDSQERFEGLGVTVIRARARFVAPFAVEADGRRIEARRFVIATGSRPAAPPVPGLDDVPYLTNETVFALRERPSRLLIVGGGPIGLEMAQAHRRLGCEVTVLEGDRALGREDPELAAIALARLRAEGIAIHEQTQAASVVRHGATIRIATDDGATHEASHLLIAAGRDLALDDLGLVAGGIAASKTGIDIDDRLRSRTNRRVYAVGDAAGQGQFTHLAGYHAGIVLRSALFGLPARARADHIPRATFIDPELAQVGLTEPQARAAHGDRVEVVRVPFDKSDRAQTEAATEGLVKLIIVRGRPVGAGILGAQAGELIHLWALVLANRLKLSAVTAMVAPYPTLGELGKRAAGDHFAPRLFESTAVKRLVRLVQRVLP